MQDERMITTENGKKVYYINTSGGPSPITNVVQEKGLILIDGFKTWNPNPTKLTDSDFVFIKENLPDWFKTHTKISDNAINQLGSIDLNSLKQKTKYVFTDFFHEQEDVYLLKLEYENTTYRIYLCKAICHYVDFDLKTHESILERNKLMYPFEDEDWNRNFYETKEEYLKMRKKEEDGYNKYYSSAGQIINDDGTKRWSPLMDNEA